MRWTRDRPTQTGWYWMRLPRWGVMIGDVFAALPDVTRVNIPEHNNLASTLDVRSDEVEWAGPIPLPEGT